MARVTVVGEGPLPASGVRRLSACGLRAAQLASAAVAGGHEVELLLLLDDDSAAEPVSSFHPSIHPTPITRSTAEDVRSLRVALQKTAPDAIVGAATYASYLAARGADPDWPVWIDLFGDPMSEAQALATVRGDDSPIAEYLWMLAWCLRRGDRFSTVSRAQRLAALGQLGAAGRLNRYTVGEELVAVVPESVEAHATPDTRVDEGSFVLLFSGSFNTWIDGELLLAGVERVLARIPDARFVATGGEVPGFVERPWQRFREDVERLPSSLRNRIELLGWIALEDLRRLQSTAGCGVIPERRLPERELGSHNRSLEWLARGIPVVATDQSEIGADLARAGALAAYRPGDVDSFVAAILGLAQDRQAAKELGERGRRWVLRERSLKATTPALAEWLREPVPARDRSAGAVRPLAERQAEILRDQLTLDSRSE